MTDIAVIILTKNEEIHIGRCLERLVPLQPKEVFVVDCLSTDQTQKIVRRFDGSKEGHDRAEGFAGRVMLLEHEWPGVHGKQINWALEHAGITAKWVLRIDADEYLLPETIEEIKALFPLQTPQSVLPEDVSLVAIPLERTFWGMPVRRGVGRIAIPRLFRFGVGRCDDRLMDEKIVVSAGRMITLQHVFVDDNLNGIDWWSQKHLGYAEREARALLAGDAGGKKGVYARLPLFWRALFYFVYRYFFKGGFLEGKRGFQWHFFQGLWYRMLVDAKIIQLQRVQRCGTAGTCSSQRGDDGRV